jgi:hypothetical protein
MKRHIILFFLVMIIYPAFNEGFSQNVRIKPTRQSSMEAFSKGNYEQAYKEFSELLLIYTKDPLYKYYSAICLIKMNKGPDQAITLLSQALQGAAVVKTLPSDVLFYLGRAQQMSGKFTEAIESFNSYTEQVGKKNARELNVSEFIKQCNDKRGKIEEQESEPAKILNSNKTEILLNDNKPVAIAIPPQPDKKDSAEIKNLPAGYEKILDKALDFQYKTDSLSNLTAIHKKELEKLPNSEKPALKSKISEDELLASSFQKSADQKYIEADRILNPLEEESQQKATLPVSEQKVVSDSVNLSASKVIKVVPKQSDNSIIKKADKQSDTIRKADLVVRNTIETFTFFEVLIKPESNPNEKIKIDPEVPPGLIYRIQIAVFRNPVAPSYFLGITPIYGFKIPGTDKTNYYAGMFRRASDANKALVTVKSKGFKDSFVVALMNKNRISADRAVLMEKEWGKKPFISNTVTETPIDTVPPALCLRVEVMRSLKPIKEDIYNGIEKMAGTRGLDILSLDDGRIAYVIGKFITFESAEEYADLLIRNGFREARVIAWLGKKEIPVETARQLFENMK